MKLIIKKSNYENATKAPFVKRNLVEVCKWFNFNETLFRGAQSDVWHYAEGQDNGRLKIGNETYPYIYRVPNVGCDAVYISIDYDGNIMTIDFHNKNTNTTQFISIKGGVRR